MIFQGAAVAVAGALSAGQQVGVIVMMVVMMVFSLKSAAPRGVNMTSIGTNTGSLTAPSSACLLKTGCGGSAAPY